MRTVPLFPLVAVLLSLSLPAVLHAQEEDPLVEEEVSRPGETIAQAEARAKEALAKSNMKITVSAVGFDIPPGSDAERYLQGTARAGGGGYFTANDAGQLTAALGAAASGQTGIAGVGAGGTDAVTITAPREGDTVGPSIQVTGKTAPNALVVLYTIAYPDVGEDQPKLIPGIRHRATATGDFTFRIATPRVTFGDVNVQVRYQLHAYVLYADQRKGPETILNLFSPKP